MADKNDTTDQQEPTQDPVQETGTETVGRWSNEPVPDPADAVSSGTSRGGQIKALSTNPLIVGGTLAVLALVSVFGLSMRWGRLVVDQGEDNQMQISMSGFGGFKAQMESVGLAESAFDSLYFSISIALVVVALVGAGLVAITPLRRIGGVVAAISGLGFLGYAIYGLVTSLGITPEEQVGTPQDLGPEGEAMIQQIIDATTSSVGPGQYSVLVSGVLIAALGVYFAIRGEGPWFPARTKKAGTDGEAGADGGAAAFQPDAAPENAGVPGNGPDVAQDAAQDQQDAVVGESRESDR